MYVLVGTCWIAGTVYLYLYPVADSPGTRPLGISGQKTSLRAIGGLRGLVMGYKEEEKESEGGWRRRTKTKKGEYNSQSFQRGLNIRKFEKYGPVRDMLIVKHKANAPDSWREADVLGAGQVVQNNLGLGLGGHVVLRFNKDSIEEIECNRRVSTRSTYKFWLTLVRSQYYLNPSIR